MSRTTEEDTHAQVEHALAVAKRSDITPTQIRVPLYNSSVILVPIRKGVIRIMAQQSLLINSLLYTYDGYMKQHTDENWYFVSATTIVPSLAPKLKEPLMTAIRDAVNTFMTENPGYLDIFDVLARKQEIAKLKETMQRSEREIERNRGILNSIQATITHHQKTALESCEKLRELESEDTAAEVDVADAQAVEGTVVEIQPE